MKWHGLEFEIIRNGGNYAANYAVTYSGVVVFILKIGCEINAKWIASVVGIVGGEGPKALPFRILFPVIGKR